MGTYDRLQRIHDLRSMLVSGYELPVTGIPIDDYSLGLTEMQCKLSDECQDIQNKCDELIREINILKSEYKNNDKRRRKTQSKGR